MSRRALPWLGSSLLLVMALAGVWIWYLYSQRLLLDEDNRRELAHAARDLETILSGLNSSAKKFFKRMPASGEEREKLLPAFERRNPYIVSDAQPVETRGEPKASFCPIVVSPQKLRLAGAGKMALDLPIDIKAIFDDVVISDAFEYLFIAGADGKVLFAMEHGATASRREGLGWIDQQSREPADREHPVIGLSNLEGLTTLDRKPLDPAALAQASGTRTIRLGEDEYQLFTYPFTPKAAEGCADQEKRDPWIVGGLVSPARVWREAATMSPRSTLLLFVVLLVVIAAHPFVKIYLLRPTERFHFADACIVLPSAALLLMTATALLLEEGAHGRLKSLASGGLELLSQRIEQALSDELAGMRDQLVAFDNRLVEETGHRRLPKNDITNLLTRGARARFVGRPDLYPHLSQVAWINCDGRQIFKATVNEEVTPRLMLNKRPYFTAARDGQLWSLAGDDGDPRKPPLFVQSSRSMTTAELFTGLSVRSRLGKSCVAAISAKPLSVERPLLPAGYDFAVIAADGQVLYHSDPGRTGKEDFFEEMEAPAPLRSAVQAGAPLHLTTSYSRRSVELFVRPLASLRNAGWFIVTLRDRRWLEGVCTEALVRTMAWILLPWSFSLALSVIALLAGKRSLRHWWPDPKKGPLYRALAFAYWTALAAGIFCVAGFRPGAAWLFWFSLAFPLILASITLVVYRARRFDRHGLAADAHKNWYFAALAGLCAASAVVPTAGLFRHSWHLELDKLSRFEQVREERHQRDWSAQDEDLQRYLKISNRSEFLDIRKCQRPSYMEALAELRDTATWDQWLDRKLPIYSPTVELIRHQKLKGQAMRARSALEPVPYRNAGVAFNTLSVLGFVVVMLVTALWLRFQAHNLFWTHLAIRRPAATSELIGCERFVILLAPSLRERRDLAAKLASPEPAPQNGNPGGKAAPVLVVDFEDARLDETRRQSALSQLETAAAQREGSAVILANSDPLCLFNGEPSDGPVAAAIAEKERWLAALEPFVLRTAPINGDGAPQTAARFEALWRHCSRQEQLTLIHVAQEGFANPHQTAAVEQLLAKGLLTFDPNLKLMSPAFTQFVAQQAARSDVKSWEQPQEALGWRGARWIFGLLLLGAAAFLAGTQDSWFKGAAVAMTTVAGALEALWKVLQAVQSLHSVTPKAAG
jgi:hypothetical protein